MQQKICMDLLICNSEDKISLDEIVHTNSNEFERPVVETASETSYRRGMAQLARDGRSAPPFRTATDGRRRRTAARFSCRRMPAA